MDLLSTIIRLVWFILSIIGLIITLFLFFRTRKYYINRDPERNGVSAIIAWLHMRTHLGIFLVFILFSKSSYNSLSARIDYIPYSFPQPVITILATGILLVFVIVAILTYRDENRIMDKLRKERHDGI